MSRQAEGLRFRAQHTSMEAEAGGPFLNTLTADTKFRQMTKMG